MRPRPHGFHRNILTDLSGNDDKGNVQAFILDELEGVQTAKMRHHIISDDQIPFLPVQSVCHRLTGFDPFIKRFVALPLQLIEQESGIVFRILHQQNPQRFFHRLSPPSRGLAFHNAAAITSNNL